MLNLRQSLKTVKSISSRRTLITYSKQNQLYIHPKSNNLNSISFSSNPESLAIGQFESSTPDKAEITTKNFKGENKQFISKLHDVIKANIAQDFTYNVESKDYSGQHMPIYDLRKTPNYQRQPDVEDIFGFVRVSEDGTVDGGSYESNGLYKVVSVDGVITLSDYIHEKLVDELD